MYDIITSHFNKLYNKFSSRDRPNYNFPLLIPLANINYTWAIDPGAGYFWLGMIWGAIWERVYRYKCTHYMISQAVYYHKYCILQLYCHRYCMYSSIGTYPHKPANITMLTSCHRLQLTIQCTVLDPQEVNRFFCQGKVNIPQGSTFIGHHASTYC